jgi:RNA polymerase sigma-70 factor (ECF subfamily)
MSLLTRAQAGDDGALDELIRRYAPRLRKWIRGRLPIDCRGLCDTDDLVQDTLIRVTRVLPSLQMRHEAGLQAYFRQAVWNRLLEEIRAAPNRVPRAELDDLVPSRGPSPLEQAIGREALDRYESALGRLSDEDRAAVVGRLEFGYSYPELALMLNRRTADAARKVVERALVRLIESMGHDSVGFSVPARS